MSIRGVTWELGITMQPKKQQTADAAGRQALKNRGPPSNWGIKYKTSSTDGWPPTRVGALSTMGEWK